MIHTRCRHRRGASLRTLRSEDRSNPERRGRDFRRLNDHPGCNRCWQVSTAVGSHFYSKIDSPRFPDAEGILTKRIVTKMPALRSRPSLVTDLHRLSMQL
jgi:hypothetical protein